MVWMCYNLSNPLLVDVWIVSSFANINSGAMDLILHVILQVYKYIFVDKFLKEVLLVQKIDAFVIFTTLATYFA